MSSNEVEWPVTAPSAGLLNEQEKQLRDDYEWCASDTEVRRRYGGQVVAAHRHRIWGAGPNHHAALKTALQEPGCPPRHLLAFVVVATVSPGSSAVAVHR